MSKMTELEQDELRKSLRVLGTFSTSEIEGYIQKAMKTSVPTAGVDDPVDDPEDDTAEEQNDTDEGSIEPTIAEKMKGKTKGRERSLGPKKGEDQDEVIQKSIENAWEARSAEFQKSITDQISDGLKPLMEVIARLQGEVRQIGDTPLGRKAIVTSANFFEKGMFNEIGEERTLSISRDRDILIKSMGDELFKSKDPITQQMLEDGISDYTVNKSPNGHGIKALAFISRQQNIKLES